MGAVAIFIYFMLFIVWIVEALHLYWSLGLKKSVSAKINGKIKGSVSLIVPFKGYDHGLEENIRAILNQNYIYKEAIFVIDSLGDPAYKIVSKFGKNKKVKVLVKKEADGYAAKIASLVTGLKAASGDIFVFADSDIRPHRNWLGNLVNSLSGDYAVATGYRWYFPEKRNFSGFLKSAWNTVGLTTMFNKKHNYVWGGSFAIRRSVFDKLQILKYWKGEMSDDSVITLRVKGAGMKINFVPSAVAASFDDTDFSQLMEFTNRQIAIVSAYFRKTWKAALLFYSFYNFALILGASSLLFGFAAQNMFYLLSGVALLLTQLLHVLRAELRYVAFKNILPEYKKEFDRNHASVLFEFLVKPLVNYNLLKAAFTKRVVWRGRKFNLDRKI